MTGIFPPKEPCPQKATLAKVVPTPNNGSVELVPLRRDRVRENREFPPGKPGIPWDSALESREFPGIQPWKSD